MCEICTKHSTKKAKKIRIKQCNITEKGDSTMQRKKKCKSHEDIIEIKKFKLPKGL